MELDLQKLSQIIMKWSIENEEWETVLKLYTIYGIGIPVRYLYILPKKNLYENLNTALQRNQEIELYSNDFNLRKLLSLFQHSKWKRLEEWSNSYGYSYINN